MSKVDAYICDFKNHLVLSKATVGINPVEDMFDRERSFPTVFTPLQISRTDVHYCTDCYKEKVLVPAGNMVNRRGKMSKDDLVSKEREYELKIKELAYNFRSQVVKNHRDKNRFKKSS